MLGVETATALGGVAIATATGTLLAECTLRSHESHAERILPAVGHLLQTIGAGPGDLAAVAASRGPGSFTGLRAGVATAKGLAFSLAVPLFGVPTLHVLAANAPPGPERICAVLNARRGEVFREHFRAADGRWQSLGPAAAVPSDELAGELPDGCLVVGELPAALAAGHRAAPPHLCHPRAAVVAALGALALAESRPSELASLLPAYLRPADAVPARRAR